jgi:HPt (histidine-containing phosphotransfer) domain-containing protein
VTIGGGRGGGVTSDEELIAELWLEVRPSQIELVHELVADGARMQDEPTDTEAWARIGSVAHRLAGTLGSFGQQPAGTTAVALDQVVRGASVPDEETVARAANLIAALHEELVHTRGEHPEA